MRSGKAYLAAPLGTLSVGSRTAEAVELISDLDAGGWLSRIRRLGREKGVPARARMAVKQLEDALFAMSEAHAHVSERSVQGALGALGDLVRWLRDSRDAPEKISLPPRLSYKWVRMADDGTPEYRVAAALASLGWSSGENPRQDTPVEGEAPSTDPADAAAPKKRIALAAHFAPLGAETINQTRVVWGAGSLEFNLIAVLQRRLIDESIAAPLDAAAPARLADITAFIEGEFDDVKCARLLAGLVWAQPPRWLPFVKQPRPVVPFAYAALKPIFAPATSLKTLVEKGLVPPNCKLPIPPGLVSRLRSGGVEEAVSLALARARASGIASPFASPGMSKKIETGSRLAAALLIPIDEYGLETLMERAYPVEKENEDVD